MRIIKEESIAIMVDIQDKLLPAMFHKEELIENTIKLLKGFKALDMPVLVSQQYTKGLGDTVNILKDLLDQDTHYFDKISFSCYEDEDIKMELKNRAVKNIIIFGIEAHICVQQTVIDCLAAGYQVIVVTDCISSRKKTDRKIAIHRYEEEGAILATYESILFELTRQAGNDTFKEISKIIK
ncbi:MAG: hydrolase [Anaerocolumna sp.]